MAYQMLQSLERVCRLNIDNDPEMIRVAAGAESPGAAKRRNGERKRDRAVPRGMTAGKVTAGGLC